MSPSPLISRVRLTNFRSITSCDVQLGPLTILVGPNGSGKSNFLDALRFVADVFTFGLDHTVRVRGLADEIIPRSAVAAGVDEFSIALDLVLPEHWVAQFAFTLALRSLGGSEVRNETCTVMGPDWKEPSGYEVVDGRLLRWFGTFVVEASPAPASPLRGLYLLNVSGFPEFRPVYEALSKMVFYNLIPSLMRAPRLPDTGDHLIPDGANVVSVLRQISERRPALKRRIEEYLDGIVIGTRGVDTVKLGRHMALEFQQAPRPDAPSWRFQADQMSEGTIRALGILVALFQGRMAEPSPVSLVAIEEPENALHPAAAGVLLDALLDASETTQVVVTTHSADLLDRVDPDDVTLLAVSSEDGVTRIGPVDRVGRTAIRERLYTPGELLRMDQLRAENGESDGAARPSVAALPE